MYDHNIHSDTDSHFIILDLSTYALQKGSFPRQFLDKCGMQKCVIN